MQQDPDPYGRYERFGLDHLQEVIKNNDIKLLQEFIVLRPGLLGWQDKEMAIPDPITKAAWEGSVDALRVLLEYRASLPVMHVHEDESHEDETYGDIERRFFTPLNAACYKGQSKIVSFLLGLDPPWDIEEKDDLQSTPLLSALCADRGLADETEEIVRLLLDRGADATVVMTSTLDRHHIVATALTHALSYASPHIIRWLVEAVLICMSEVTVASAQAGVARCCTLAPFITTLRPYRYFSISV